MSLFMSVFFFGLGIIHLVRSKNFPKNYFFLPRENVCICIRVTVVTNFSFPKSIASFVNDTHTEKRLLQI